MMCFPNMCLPQSTPELSFTLDTFDTKFLSLYILYLFYIYQFFLKNIYENGICGVRCVRSVGNREVLSDT